jgi:hypothetical protein
LCTVLWDFIDDTWVSWPREPTEFDDVSRFLPFISL